MKTSVLQRFPTLGQVAPIYALTLFLFTSWTSYHLFWKLPAWLNYLQISEIFPLLAYSISLNMLESLTVVGGLAGLAAILPKSWFRDAFIPVGAAFTLMSLGYLVLFLNQFFLSADYPMLWVKTLPGALLGIFLLASGLGRIAVLRRLLEALADRSLVFLYILLPLGIVSLGAVLVLNSF
jgi:hypothetical protein